MTSASPVILVTGASVGIGWYTAHELAKSGARLALAARRKELLEDLARTLKNEFQTECHVVVADIRKRSDIERMIESTVSYFGRIDVLINNAGVLFMGPFERMPEETMRDAFETNFWSLVHAIQLVVPIMEKQGGGHIINVGSGVSRRGLAYMAAYAASKFALAGLSESVRLEYHSRNIHFTSVYPGGVDTDMPRKVDRSHLPAGYRENTRYYIRPRRVAKAIARAVRCRPLEVYVPWWLRFGAWACVVWPSFMDLLIRKRQRL